MNILIFTALYPPHIGGVERYAQNISYALNRLGHKVTVVTSALYKDPGITTENGILILRFPCLSIMNGRLPIIWKDRTFRKMEKKLKVNNYDFCMINTRFYPLSLYAAYYTFHMGIKNFVLDHGSAHLSFGNPVLDFLENIYEHSITWIIKKYCHSFYGVSRDSELFLQHFHILSKGVLHNAIDVNEIEQIAGNTYYDVRKIYQIPEDSVIISYIGRLVCRKGVLELNNAVSKLIDQYPQLYLIYAGDGELESRLAKEKSSHTILLGKLEHDKAIKLMKQSNIFCLPSETEGFSTTILEAGACKTFIITTATGGSKELIENEEYGMLIDNNNPFTIMKAIKKALDMGSNHRRNTEENCYEKIKGNYSWEQVAKKIVMEYQNA